MNMCQDEIRIWNPKLESRDQSAGQPVLRVTHVHIVSGRFARGLVVQGYLAREKQRPLGPYSRTMAGALWWPSVGGLFLMIEVPL